MELLEHSFGEAQAMRRRPQEADPYGDHRAHASRTNFGQADHPLAEART
jgi:hypothetical protein